MADVIAARGGWVDPDVVVVAEGGSLRTEKRTPPHPGRPLVAVPEELLLPADELGLQIAGDDFALEPGALTPVQADLARAMVEIYNETGKVRAHRTGNVWFRFRDDPDLLAKLLAARSLGDTAARRFAFTREPPDPAADRRMLCETFLSTRAIADTHRPAVGTEATRRRIVPFVDFVNHDHAGGEIHLVRPHARRDSPQGLVVLDVKRPVADSPECFAAYGRLDALDTFLHYGFIDARAPYVRSVPLRITMDGPGEIIVDAAARRRTTPADPEDPLAPWMPAVTATPDSIEISHLMIPCLGPNPDGLRQVLGRLLVADGAVSGAALDAAVRDLERAVVTANTVFYEALLNESAGDSGAGCARIVHGLARFQLSKLSTYSTASSPD
jgi:hypothetical protein